MNAGFPTSKGSEWQKRGWNPTLQTHRQALNIFELFKFMKVGLSLPEEGDSKHIYSCLVVISL